MKRYVPVLVLAVFTVAACFSVALAEDMRTWTDSSGRFTVEAVLVSFEDDSVKLKKADGTVLALTIDKLSEADKIYLAEASSSANPFEVAERAATRAPATSPTSPAKTVDIADAKEIGDYGETSWSCPPDPAPLENLASKRFTFRAGTIPLHSHAKDYGFFFSRDGKKVLYTLQVPKPSIGEGDESTRIFLADVASGEINMMKNSLCLTPYGLSPDGSKAMFVQSPWGIGIHTGQKGKILLFNTSNQLEPFTILNPIDHQGRLRNQEKADVEQATWVSDEHILVLYASGADRSLVLANINTGKALWRLKPDLGGGRSLTLSPSGKYFLVKAGKAMLLIDTISGKTVGSLADVNEYETAKYSFSPDGRRIASCAGGMIRIWDATTGQPEETFFIEGAGGYSTFTWIGDRHLMVGNQLIETALQVPVWEYLGFINNGDYFGGQFWHLMGSNDAKTLVGVKIPQQKVLDRFSGVQNDANLFAVQPGMAVALEIDPSVSKDQDEIRRSIEKKIQDNGLTLADNAPVTFLLKVTEEGEKTVTYTTSRFPFAAPSLFNRGGGTDVQYRQDKYEFLIQQDGKTLWNRLHVAGAPRCFSGRDCEYVVAGCCQSESSGTALQGLVPAA
ncbi:MAG: SHD1 domain-containing protein [Planctomycetaceae bacterium]|nr:SHD1 domain-containing protein [Planctomycetaceae bacterium]